MVVPVSATSLLNRNPLDDIRNTDQIDAARVGVGGWIDVSSIGCAAGW
jgi:hypothetical protein